MKNEKRLEIWVKLLALYPPPTLYKTHTPLYLRDTSLLLTPALCPLMESQHIPPGNQGLAATVSRANTTRLQATNQENVSGWSTAVLNAPGPPKGVVVPTVHLVHSDPF